MPNVGQSDGRLFSKDCSNPSQKPDLLLLLTAEHQWVEDQERTDREENLELQMLDEQSEEFCSLLISTKYVLRGSSLSSDE